jgi:hypothetical protein
MSAPARPKYRTANWKTDNEALKTRGSLLIWLGRDMSWHGSANGKRGRSPKYSQAAIQFCLIIKGLFNLVLRQAMGMAQVYLGSLAWTDKYPISAPSAAVRSISRYRSKRAQR